MILFLALVWLFIIGAIAGSYSVATVWRLRAIELLSVKKTDLNKLQKQEYQTLVTNSKLASASTRTDYSHCLHCQHRLAWYDLMPVVSWLSIGGKCRYCKKPIGWLEFVTEVGLGCLFAVSYVFLGGVLSWGVLIAWYGLLMVLTILFIYDAKWQLLPTSILWLAICLAGVCAGLTIFDQVQSGQQIVKVLMQYAMSVGILGGLYWLLAKISQESWVGAGDAYVGLVLGLVLGNVWLAMVALFLANLIGCVVVFMRALITKKSIRRMRVAFAPMLISALVIVYFCKALILAQISWLMFDI